MLDFRPLARVEHVFECERVKVESFSEQPQYVDVAEAVDIDPRYPIVIEMFEKFVAIGDQTFLEMRSIIFNQSDDWRTLLDIGAKIENAGRFARNGLTDSEHTAFSRAIASKQRLERETR